MSNRLPDNVAACNLIKSIRKEEREYARRNRRTKAITIPLEMVEGKQLSAFLAVSANIATGTVCIQGCALSFHKQRIHPETHQKRQCGTEKALKLLRDARKYSREGSQKRKTKNLNL